MKKRVEQFHAPTPYDLETTINNFCENYLLFPCSVSVVKDGDEFVAFVVVEVAL